MRMIDFGRSFATREKAKRIAKEVPERGSLVIDFGDVVVLSPSFADEFIGRIAAASQDVTLEHLAPELEELMARTVERRGLSTQVRIAALA